MKKITPPTIAWGSLVADIVIADALLIYYRQMTMSSAFRAAANHPVKRWPITLVWATVTVHLFTEFKYDPIHLLGKWIAKRMHEHDI